MSKSASASATSMKSCTGITTERSIKGIVSEGENVKDAIIDAKIYELNKMYNKALECYARALKHLPENVALQKKYIEIKTYLIN